MRNNYIILYGDKKLREHLTGVSSNPSFQSTKKNSRELTSQFKYNFSVEQLEVSNVESIKNRNQDIIAIAPALPLKLIKPVKSELVSKPEISIDPWNIEAIGADKTTYTGKNIKIAILDTGIDNKHIAFQGMNIVEKDFTGEGNGDTNGHGTHCAGVAFGRNIDGQRIGVAQGVEDVIIAKVLGENGGGSDILVNGINWAIESGANVISMSLGIDFPGYARDLEEQGMQKEAAISFALEGYRKNILLFEKLASLIRVQSQSKFTQPVLIVSAAGNESSRPSYKIAVSPPAISDGILSVGALGKSTSGLYVADFSNTGVIISAPGVGIVSAKTGGGLISMDGTSMATPHVAGVAALWAEKLSQKNQFSASALYSNLTVSCDDQLLTKDDVEDYGSGMIKCP